MDGSSVQRSELLFENPFSIEDIQVFDDDTMQRMFCKGGFGLTVEDLAWSLQGMTKSIVRRVWHNVPKEQRTTFGQALRQPITNEKIQAARRRVLDSLFWELTYWKMPELYEELTEGEHLHPGIFQHLAADLRGKTVLDVGAGSGRASFECIRYGAKLVYAVEPSPGLLHILEQKLPNQSAKQRIVVRRGCFEQVPLADGSVDIALSCSAFTSEPGHGGEQGLAELRRVTKRGGKIVLIWPRQEDYDWLLAHGFQHVALPLQQEMQVHFRSFSSALRCARLFYAHNQAVLPYLLRRKKPDIPFSVLGFNPPRDYCWQTVI